MENREVTYSESRYYMVRSGKGLNTSLFLRAEIPNNKQKARFAITDITDQDSRKFLKKF